MHCSATESTKIVDPHSRVVSSRCAFCVIHEFFSAPTVDGVDPRYRIPAPCSGYRKLTNIRQLTFILSVGEDVLEI